MPDLEALQLQAQEMLQTVLIWLQSPPFWAQIAGIVVAWFVARFVTKILRNKIPFLNTKPTDGRFLFLRDMVYRARDLVGSLLLVAALAVVVSILDAVTGSSWLVKIAQSLALVLALKKAIELFIPAPGLQNIIKLIVLPSALMMVFGVFDQFTAFLDTVALQLGNIRLSALF